MIWKNARVGESVKLTIRTDHFADSRARVWLSQTKGNFTDHFVTQIPQRPSFTAKECQSKGNRKKMNARIPPLICCFEWHTVPAYRNDIQFLRTRLLNFIIVSFRQSMGQARPKRAE